MKASGDTDIDVHHTVEDTGIVLGQALKQALGDKSGIGRYGDAVVPLDEALVQAVVDVSGRPYLVHSGEPAGFAHHLIGGHFTGSLVRHVFESIAFNAGITVHITVLAGRDPHHIAEAEFKAFARAFRARRRARPARVGRPVDEGRAVAVAASAVRGRPRLRLRQRALRREGARGRRCARRADRRPRSAWPTPTASSCPASARSPP